MKTLNKDNSKKVNNINFGFFDKLKYYSLTILFLGGSIAMLFFFAWPQYQKINENKQNISNNEGKLNKVKIQAEYLLSLEDMQDELVQNEELAKRALPEEDFVPDMFNQLIQIADDSFVELKTLSLGNISENDVTGFSEVTAQISVSGNLEQIITYLTNLEESLRMFKVESLNFKYEDTKNVTTYTANVDSKISLSFQLTSYFMPPVNADNVSIEQIMEKPRLEGVINTLKNKVYYEPEQYDLELGKENPFIESLPENIRNRENSGGIAPAE